MQIQHNFAAPIQGGFLNHRSSAVGETVEEQMNPPQPEAPTETVEVSGSPEFPPNDHLVQVLEDGIANQQVVQIDYVTKSGYYLANQDLEPLKIKKKTGAGHVILKAYCRNQEGIRNYRIERILEAEPTGETFEPRTAKVFVEDPVSSDQPSGLGNAPDLLTVLDGDGPLTESGLKQALVKEGVKMAAEVVKEQLVS